jgi:hypothetical protein
MAQVSIYSNNDVWLNLVEINWLNDTALYDASNLQTSILARNHWAHICTAFNMVTAKDYVSWFLFHGEHFASLPKS